MELRMRLAIVLPGEVTTDADIARVARAFMLKLAAELIQCSVRLDRDEDDASKIRSTTAGR